MNILPVTYTGTGFQVSSQFLSCPLAVKNRLQLVEGQSFDLGIRPEHIEVFEPQRHGEEEVGQLVIEVKVVEPLGRETLIRGVLLDSDVQVNVQATPDVRPRLGDRIPLQLDLDKLFGFDPATGNILFPQ